MRLGIVWVESRDGTVRYCEPKPFSDALAEYKALEADPKDKIRLGSFTKVKTRVVEPVAATPVEPEPAPVVERGPEPIVEPAPAAPEPTTKRKKNRKDN